MCRKHEIPRGNPLFSVIRHCPAFLTLFLLHTPGESMKRIGKISRRPSSISIDITNFENGVKELKFPVGPTTSRPGPMLLNVAMTADTVVGMPLPSKEMIRIDTIMIIR